MLKQVSRLLKLAGILLMLIGVLLVGYQLVQEMNSGIQANESLTSEETSPIYVYTLNIPTLQLILPIREEPNPSDSYSGVLLSESQDVVLIEIGKYLASEMDSLSTDTQAILTDSEGVRYLYQLKRSRKISNREVLSPYADEDMILVIQDDENESFLVSFNLILVDGDEAGN